MDKDPTAATPQGPVAESAARLDGREHQSAERVNTAQLFRRELTVGLVINTVIIPTIIWLTRAPAPVTTGDLVADSLKATGFAVLFMTLGVTISMRIRGRKGIIPKLIRSGPAWLASVPRVLLARALIFAIVAIVLLAPCRAVVVQILNLLPMQPGVFVLINVLYGAVINYIVGPFIVRAAMNDVVEQQARVRT